MANTKITAANIDSTSTGITLADLTVNGDINLGDNDKAVFGAGSDLQIYHDGSHSFIYDGGVGDLKLQATNLLLEATDGTNYIHCADDGAVRLYYNGLTKLATTSTGIDVTGTATMDGLTVDGDATISDSTNPTLTITDTTTPTSLVLTAGNLSTTIGTTTDHLLKFETNNTERLRIENNGDISFYEDTGTTAKFFWDASAESLGIGTTNPDSNLHVSGTGNRNIKITAGTNSSASLRLVNDAHDWDVNCQTNDNFAIYSQTDTTERLIINPSTEITLKPNNGTVIVDGGTADYEPAKVELQGRAFGGDITAKYEVSDGGAVFFGSTTNHSVRFIANNTEKLRIESSQILLNGGTQTYSNNQRLQSGSESITWSSSTSAQSWTSSNYLPYQKFVEAALHFGYVGNGAISQHFYISLLNNFTGLSIQTIQSSSGNSGSSYHTISFTSTGAYNTRRLVVQNTPASGQNTANLNGTIYYGFAR